jgi:hypothetical protein
MGKLLTASALIGIAVCLLLPTFYVVDPLPVGCGFAEEVLKSIQPRFRKGFVLPQPQRHGDILFPGCFSV